MPPTGTHAHPQIQAHRPVAFRKACVRSMHWRPYTSANVCVYVQNGRLDWVLY